ncbi:hypothetical protein TCAL_04656 [Tigriopus californicus]|uniref:L-Fucosyltransferase n=2 Tax=Tigriopus californicus TaxID=6832 RepID=A0A553NCY3_TIGCA|nr:hypothetical protein TCAL_04656 [Tigriopus californicus]
MEPSRFVSFGRGRLGNQMSSLATIIAFSQRLNITPFVTQEQAEMLWEYFDDLDLHVLEDEMPNYQDYRWINPFRLIDEHIWNFDYSILFSPDGSGASLLLGQTIEVGHYPNEVHMFRAITPSLQSVFRLKDRYVLNAQRNLELARSEFLEKRTTFHGNSEELEGSVIIKPEDISFVSIHIRRGDYAEHLKSLYHIGYVKPEYYSEAIEWFKGAFKCPLFFIVSDDLEWAENELGDCNGHCFYAGSRKSSSEFDPNVPLATSPEIGNDLALLSQVNHSIITYGTFGMWGALLAGGQTLLPKGFDNMKEVKEIRRANFRDWTFI